MDTKTLYTRLATVPGIIKGQLGSEDTINFIDQIYDRFHLPVTSAGVVGKLLQKLQTKEVGADYFTGELALELNLEKDKALLISGEIKKAILLPIQKDFSDYGVDISLLDKFQTPAIKPKILSEIKPPSPTQPPQPQPLAPTAVGFASKASPMTQLTPQPGASLKANAPSPILNKDGTAPAPKSTSDIGWSKQTSQNPVVQLGVITPSMPSPTQGANASAVPKPQVPQQSATSAVKGMSEFERIDAIKKGGVPQIPKAPTIGSAPVAPATTAAPTPTAAPQPKPQEAAPMMLHEIPSQTSLQTSPNFKFSITAENQINTAGPQKSIQEKPAMVEFGNRPAASSGAPTPTAPASTPKMVHYSEYKTSIPPLTPSANDGPRQITEIGMQTPGMTPGIAPMTPPPMPPKPPSPAPAPMQTSTQPPTQQGKVIVQDFLDPKKP